MPKALAHDLSKNGFHAAHYTKAAASTFTAPVPIPVATEFNSGEHTYYTMFQFHMLWRNRENWAGRTVYNY